MDYITFSKNVNKTKSCYFILFPFLCAGEELSTTELSRFSRYSFGQENRELADFTYIIINTLCYASLHFKREWNLPLNWAVTHNKKLKITACPPLPLVFWKNLRVATVYPPVVYPSRKSQGVFTICPPLTLAFGKGPRSSPLALICRKGQEVVTALERARGSMPLTLP